MMTEINQLVESHQLRPHPEGGYYKETYRSQHSTGIYYLLEKGDFSSLHRISRDEMWHFYGGDSLVVMEISEEGKVLETLLNQKNPQYVVKGGRWFGAYLPENSNYAFCGCTVSPAFSFEDFKLANLADLSYLSEEVLQRVSKILRR
ncbi:MAG: cupin domain-containing protein [Bacteriovoracaceae bacterium]